MNTPHLSMKITFDHLTPHCRRALDWAHHKSGQLYQLIGTDYLLLALVRMRKGVAMMTLYRWRTNLRALHGKLAWWLGFESPSLLPPDEITFTEVAENAWRLAEIERIQMGHFYLGTEHLIMGMIQTPHCLAAQILKEMEIEKEALHQGVLDVLEYGYRGREIDGKSHLVGRREFEGLSLAMRAVILDGGREARQFHQEVGTGHLLLALARRQWGKGGQDLAQRNLVLEDLIQQIEWKAALEPSLERYAEGLTLTRPAAELLEAATCLARDGGSSEVDTDHFLEALAEQEEGIGGEILRKHLTPPEPEETEEKEVN